MTGDPDGVLRPLPPARDPASADAVRGLGPQALRLVGGKGKVARLGEDPEPAAEDGIGGSLSRDLVLVIRSMGQMLLVRP